MRSAQSKILSRSDAIAAVRGHKRDAKRVVLANGCFDTLHVGHVRYLAGAKQEGDILVVGVNSDSSVGCLKGPGRPILDERARALLVASLRDVDYVVIFPEVDVAALLVELRPDVHAKGTDYTAETVPERQTSARLGIRVAIVGDSKNHSTRRFFEAIRKGPNG
jgi:D-glycero-beta-D-manno-heptose 1-phosphate adenylyltransferase